MTAARQHPRALMYASEETRADRGVVLAAIQEFPVALQHASLGLRADKELVWLAVQAIPAVIFCASEEIKGDKEFVLRTIQGFDNDINQDLLFLLRCVSPSLQNDKDVVWAALRKYVHNPREYWLSDLLCFVSEELQNDREIFTYCIRIDKWSLVDASPNFNSIHVLWQLPLRD
jgi:hypothetical protein